VSSWDERDTQLNTRERLAQIVAEVVSGVENAEPTEMDFELTDKVRDQLEIWIRQY